MFRKDSDLPNDFMADEMRSLRDVPPMQLSNERLRDAILTAGLDARPAAPAAKGWAWTLAPIAAALLAVVIVPRLRAPSAPIIRLSPETVAMRAPRLSRPEPLPLVPVPARPSTAAAAAEEARAPVPPKGLVARNHRAAPSVRRRSSVVAARTVAPPTMASASDASAGRVGSSAPGESLANATMVAETDAASATAPAEPLVLLADRPDPQTGASAATELDSARNVSVGG